MCRPTSLIRIEVWTLETKYCFRCETVKPVVDFYGNRSRFDGLGDECKLCNRRLRKQHYARNANVIKRRNLEYYRMNREAINAKRRVKYKASREVSRLDA